MTEHEAIKDAIEVLGFLKKDFENKAKPRCQFKRVRFSLSLAIQALENQIAKKPAFVYTRFRHYGKHISDGQSIDKCYKCPNCNSHVFHVFDDEKYCKYCGQKLDWE